MIQSMTGFGRCQKTLGSRDITVEIKAVNHRYLEFSSRLPRSLGFIEDKLKAQVQSRIARGKVEVSVTVAEQKGSASRVTLNEGLALSYLEELSGSPALSGTRRICENDTANAVLTAKAEAMRQAGLAPDFAVVLPEQLPLSDLDLAALLGNALDNAMEAAVQAEDKTVSVRCRVRKGLFMLQVENALGAEVAPDLATTKADKAAHGLGLPGMREIAERYRGTLEARAGAGEFELTVCLPLEGPPAEP